MLVLALALAASACTDSRAGQDNSLSTATSALHTLQPPTTTTATSTFTPTTSAPQPTTSAIPDDLFRLAPRSETILAFRSFDHSGSYFSGHGQTYFPASDGPLVELVDLYVDGGLIFQRSWEDNVIWTTADGVKELLVGAENQRLELEGGELVGDDSEQPVVYYQRHTRASPEETESSLRSFDPTTGEVTVIAQTGGWEAGTSFAYLTGGKAVALSHTEALDAMYVIDLDTDRGINVFDLPPLCPTLTAVYSDATFVDDQVVGARPIFNTHDGVVDQWGFFLLDPETCEEELVDAFPWDNGEWYIESLVGSIVNL